MATDGSRPATGDDDGGSAARDDPADGATAAGDAPLPPGPDGYPIVGNTVSFLRKGPFDFFEEDVDDHGDVVRYTVGGLDFVTLLHPDYVEEVLLTDPDSFSKWQRDEFLPGSSSEDFAFAPEGVLFTEGEQWRTQRTLLQNAFTMDRIREYADAMVDITRRTVADWEDGRRLVANREMSDLTLSILTHSLFELPLDDERSEIVSRFTRILNERAEGDSLTTFLPMWLPLPSNRRYKRALSEFRSFVDDLVDERRGDGGDHDDLLALLLDAETDDGRTLSETEIRDQMVTFLFAGHETTSLALTYALLALSQTPDVRDRLHAEWDEHLDGDPVFGDLASLPYTGKVLKETLRLYPPAYVLFRQAEADVEIGGYRIPEGTRLTIPQFHVHTDPRFYDDPESFRPGRWTDEMESDLPDYAYFPFGGGPRHCIGMRFARMEFKLALPTILRRYDVELLSDPDPEFSPGATLQPAEDVELRVHER